MERSHAPRRSPWAIRPALVVAGAALVGLGLALPGLAAGLTVQAVNYEFIAPGGGSSLTVTVGDQVTWEAAGDPHTVTSGTPGAIDNRFPDRPASEGFLLAGSSFTTTFTAPGTFPYFCEVHFETMTGTIVVASATTPAPTTAPTTPPTPRPAPTPTPAPTSAPTFAPTTLPSPVPTPTGSPSPSAAATQSQSPSPTPSPETTAEAPASPSLAPLPTGPESAASGDGADGLPIAVAAIAAAGLAAGLFVARRRRGSSAAD